MAGQPTPQQIEQEMARMAQQEEQRQAFEEQKNTVLAAVMDTAAKDRLSRIKIVKPDVAQRLEMMIMQLAQQNRLQGKISETEFISLLQQVQGTGGDDESARRGPKIEMKRRDIWDSDSD